MEFTSTLPPGQGTDCDGSHAILVLEKKNGCV
jgi:hypothetical protein